MVGPAMVIAFFKWIFKVNISAEAEAYTAALMARHPPMAFVDVQLTNPMLAGHPIREFVFARTHNILFTRLLHEHTLMVPTADTCLAIGDVIRAVGPKPVLDELVQHMGKLSRIDLATVPSDVGRVDLLVTKTSVLRKPLRSLDLINRHGVTLTRLTRNGVDLLPAANMTLQFGDRVTAVGPTKGVGQVEMELGNSPDALNRPQLIPIFLGIVLGVIVGCIPIGLPGHGGIQLGLAAGPMLVAIVMSRFGNIGSMVWYMPAAANQLFRDFGLAVFLACVGLQQGNHFVQKLIYSGGLPLVIWGAVITVVPLFIVGCVARTVLKMNFLTLAGWCAGAMTSSPALMYADEITHSDAPALAYAAVAPLAMIVPILCCQFLAAIR
jgi:putative transport protein